MQIVIMLNMALMVIENVLIRKQIIITAASMDQLDDVSKNTFKSLQSSLVTSKIFKSIGKLMTRVQIEEE